MVRVGTELKVTPCSGKCLLVALEGQRTLTHDKVDRMKGGKKQIQVKK